MHSTSKNAVNIVPVLLRYFFLFYYARFDLYVMFKAHYTRINEGLFTSSGTIIGLPQCQLINPDIYG